MNITRRLMMIGAALGLAGCAAKIRVYDGPEITRVQVFKEARMMRLLSDSTVMRTYNFELGFAPTEHKKIEGDGRTPEGAYLINRLNPNSRFHLSLGISYPDADDVSYARSVGKSPGGNIFIHGTPTNYLGKDDWTWGCIAVTNEEIEEIYAMVNIGTIIYIYP
ncbi:MAG: murein L,D-transpeptidase YafK [Yoonia sp.]|jgi:murein L,D-transpeptidase YafK